MRLGAKGPIYPPPELASRLDKLSKAALIDLAWNLAAMGTDDNAEVTFNNLRREAAMVCLARGDAIPKELRR
jgi:hypothetical protein